MSVALGLFLLVPSHSQEPKLQKKADKVEESVVLQKLQLNLPSIQLNNATLEESMQFLRLRSIELDPEPDRNKKGINIVVRKMGDEPKIIDDLDLRDVTFQQAFAAVCRKTGTRYTVDKFAISIVPLEHKGKEKDKIAIDPEKAKKEQAAREKNLAELQKIIIPTVTFENVTLEEAVHFLRQRSLELDPARKGVNLNFFEGKKLKEKVVKTLNLRNVPLTIALKYICETTQTRFEAEGRNISILPQKE